MKSVKKNVRKWIKKENKRKWKEKIIRKKNKDEKRQPLVPLHLLLLLTLPPQHAHTHTLTLTHTAYTSTHYNAMVVISNKIWPHLRSTISWSLRDTQRISHVSRRLVVHVLTACSLVTSDIRFDNRIELLNIVNVNKWLIIWFWLHDCWIDQHSDNKICKKWCKD